MRRKLVIFLVISSLLFNQNSSYGVKRSIQKSKKTVELKVTHKNIFSEAFPANLPPGYIRGLKTNKLSWETKTSISFFNNQFTIKKFPVYWNHNDAYLEYENVFIKDNFNNTLINENSRDVFSFGYIDFYNGDEPNESKPGSDVAYIGVGPTRLLSKFSIDANRPTSTFKYYLESGLGKDYYPLRFQLSSTPNDNPNIKSDDYIRSEFFGGSTEKLNFLQRNSTHRSSTLYFQYLGAAMKDTLGKPRLVNNVDIPVKENSKIRIYLYGRLYSTCDSIISDGADDRNKSVLIYKDQLSPVSNFPNKLSNGTISATFTPNHGLSLLEAASVCGYRNFNWYQKITKWGYYLTKIYFPLVAVKYIPLTDPPRCRLTGEKVSDPGLWTDNFPFYFNQDVSNPPIGCRLVGVPKSLQRYNEYYRKGNTVFEFNDTPNTPIRDSELKCFMTPLPFVGCDPIKEFTTYLVGVDKDHQCHSNGLYKFTWFSNFNRELNKGSILNYQRKGRLNPDSKEEKGVGDFYGKDFYAKDVRWPTSTQCHVVYDGTEIK